MSSSPLIPKAASVRGGASSEGKEETPKTVEEIQDEALSNISNCVKMACTAGVIGTASVLWESYQRTHKTFDLNVAEQGDILVHLFDFIFAAGLHQAYLLFQQSRGGDRMSPPKQLKLVQILSRLWMTTTVLLAMENIGEAYDLKIPNLLGIASVVSVLNIPFGAWFHSRSLAKEEPPEVAPEYAPARQEGLNTARNMFWVVGSIAIGGVIEVVKYTTSTLKAESTEDKVGEFIGGLLDVSDSVIIGGLLASLYKTLLRAILVSTKRHFSVKDPAYKEYYQAQTKFYGRVASFFGYQALFTVLGYVAKVGEKLWFKYMG